MLLPIFTEMLYQSHLPCSCHKQWPKLQAGRVRSKFQKAWAVLLCIPLSYLWSLQMYQFIKSLIIPLECYYSPSVLCINSGRMSVTVCLKVSQSARNLATSICLEIVLMCLSMSLEFILMTTDGVDKLLASKVSSKLDADLDTENIKVF